ncbi:Zinc finger PHD-finger [Penicillium soppii]|uniref:Zinc finger PHD-finger n=1 Tax=Penicillium soppii TaxID=69789 RepID=UPI002547C4C9|nr:Zinc finger PHD-finger [Penicillium soppii]KAJ5852038.1 Zinc finger PHD-finger [Penicillium soppii]
MRLSAAFMDLPAPDINPGPSQNVPESHIFDLMGPAESQFLMDNFHSEDWAGIAQSHSEPVLMTSAETPGSSRTRSARRTNRPAALDPNPLLITKPSSKRTKTPIKRKRVKSQVNIVCTSCHRGNSPSNNLIVLCDGCDAPWHQLCHNPNIGREHIQVVEMDWFCIKCNPNQREPTPKSSSKKPGRPKKATISGQTEHQYSENDRRAYLSSLSHETLVQLMLKISTDWPLVPIFPPNMQHSTSSKPGPSAPAALSSTANKNQSFTLPHATSHITQSQSQSQSQPQPQPAQRATPEALTRLPSQAFTRTPARKSYAEYSDSDILSDDESDSQSRHSPAPFQLQAESPHDTDYDSEDYRSYPQACRGFQVPVSVNDLDIMAEDEGYPTFSHSIRGKEGQRKK